MIEFLPKEKLLELLVNDPDKYYKTFLNLIYMLEMLIRFLNIKKR